MNKSNISKRVKQIKKSAIHEMTHLSKSIEDVAFLSWAKPITGTPEHINEAAKEAIDKGLVSGYSPSEGLEELREEIVKKLARDNNIKADKSQIIVTVGAIEGIASAIMAIVDPGDEVIVPSPTYSTHVRHIQLASGKPVFVPLKEKNAFTLDIDDVKKAINKKTKAILFCSPNNPTGTIFTENQLRQLGQIALEKNLTIITDEAYEYFIYDNNKHFSIASIPDLQDNVISCYTFTKSYAMTGWRIGYLHASNKIIPQIKKAHIPFAICAPVVAQYAALAALKGSQECILKFRNNYLEMRNLMCDRLDAMEDIFEYTKPTGSYLMFPKVIREEGKDSLNFCKNLLRKAKVSTTPGIAFGPTGESHIRLSFCVTKEMINKAFDRIEKYFSK